MDDTRIVELYWARDEAAITETDAKYGRYCHAIAHNILGDRSDSEECVNDTWLAAWNAIPPRRPRLLPPFLGKIARNLALNRYKWDRADKRGGGQVELALDELSECLPAPGRVEEVADELTVAAALDRFLASLPRQARVIFMRRYWYLHSIREIAEGLGIGESQVKMSLLRSRGRLRECLEKEGVTL